MGDMLAQQIIDEIVRRILKVSKPRRIILFGSAATGAMSHDSDIDLLVIKRGLIDTLSESVKIRKALKGMGYAFDIIVMDEDRFEERKAVVGTICYPAAKYGRTLYDQAA